MADPTYRAAQPGEFFCPAGGKWYVAKDPFKDVMGFEDLITAITRHCRRMVF